MIQVIFIDIKHSVQSMTTKFNQGSSIKVQNSTRNVSNSQLGIENPKNPSSSSIWTRIFLLGQMDP